MSGFDDWFKTWIGVDSVTPVGEPPVPPPPPIAPEERVVVPQEPPRPAPTRRPLVAEGELEAGHAAMRGILVESGYSSFVSDEQVRHMVTTILVAAAKSRLEE